MPSLKSRLVAFYLSRTRKKAFASPQALRTWLAGARLRETHQPPVKVARRLDVTMHRIGGHPVYEAAPNAVTSGRRVVYFHGGAFCFQMTSFHWTLIAELAERTGMRFTIPIYPLAPEHDFHAMFGFAMAVYRSTLADIDARDLAFMGDSAGGNMALVVTMMAAAAGLPLPARHVLVSPGLDMTLGHEETRRVALADPWLDIPGGLEAVRMYSAGIPHDDWRISPARGDLTVLPKTLLFTGTRDLLSPDTLRFAEKARAAGVDVDLVVEPGLFHVWPLIDMPEARRARDRMVAFLKDWERD
jgi:acetyl esterase/lipase